ncbi:hypothetical protein OH492_07865 [Vibrio chagasii]|nr:hypothetical protein [Vibrio chagasii]
MGSTRSTSAAVKVRQIGGDVEHCSVKSLKSLDAEGKPIIWGPDRHHLGSYRESKPALTCCLAR